MRNIKETELCRVWTVLHLCWYPTYQTTNWKSSLTSSIYSSSTSAHSWDNFAEPSLECSTALCMASNTQAHIKCLHTCHCLLLIQRQMLLSLPIGNYSCLRGVGVLGCGRVGRFVSVCFKRRWGVAPDVWSTEPAHLNIRALQTGPWPLPFNSCRTTTMRLLQVIHQTCLHRFLKPWRSILSYERSWARLNACSMYDFKVRFLFADSAAWNILIIGLLMS